MNIITMSISRNMTITTAISHNRDQLKGNKPQLRHSSDQSAAITPITTAIIRNHDHHDGSKPSPYITGFSISRT